MNLHELDILINAIPEDDKEMINFYLKKRTELVKDIMKEISAALSKETK